MRRSLGPNWAPTPVTMKDHKGQQESMLPAQCGNGTIRACLPRLRIRAADAVAKAGRRCTQKRAAPALTWYIPDGGLTNQGPGAVVRPDQEDDGIAPAHTSGTPRRTGGA